MEQDRLTTIPKGARMLGKSASWLRSKVKAGELRCIRPGGPKAHPRVYITDVLRMRDESAENGAPVLMALENDPLVD